MTLPENCDKLPRTHYIWFRVVSYLSHCELYLNDTTSQLTYWFYFYLAELLDAHSLNLSHISYSSANCYNAHSSRKESNEHSGFPLFKFFPSYRWGNCFERALLFHRLLYVVFPYLVIPSCIYLCLYLLYCRLPEYFFNPCNSPSQCLAGLIFLFPIILVYHFQLLQS